MSNNLEPLKYTSKEVLIRFLNYFIILSIILIIATTAIYMINLNNTIDNISEEENMINIIEEKIYQEFEFITSDLKLLSENIFLKNYIESEKQVNLDELSTLFLSLSENKRIYDKIRYIDNSGIEVIRVNFNNGQPEVVNKDNLQYKGDRYYFQDIINLNSGEIYVSPMDLNAEFGVIEQPIKPVIRLGTPIFDNNNEKKGIVIINYLGEEIIEYFHEENTFTQEIIMLLNSKGYWLHSNIIENEWAFMYENKENITFGNFYNEEWKIISNKNSGVINNENGIFVFSTITPLTESMKSSTGAINPIEQSQELIEFDNYKWIIISQIPQNSIIDSQTGLLFSLLFLDTILVLFGSIFILSYSYSISKRKRAEETEMISREKFRSLVKSANDAIITINQEGKIISWNNGATNIFGYKKNSVINKSLTLIIPKKYREAHTNSLQRVISTEKSRLIGKSIELIGLKKEGEEFPIELSLSSFKSGDQIFFTGIIRDISERKNIEKEKLEIMKRMSRGIAHDLRNPLSAISGAAYVLKDASSETKEKMLSIIDKSILSSENMLKNFVDVDKEINLNLETNNINSLVDEVLSGLFVPDNIKIIFNKDELPLINTDKMKIERVFINIILNAIQAMPKGGEIYITTKKLKDNVEISIKDNGIGIPKENIKKLFTPFFTSKDKGIGLGLINAKRIIEAHKGTISVLSQEGKGTTFIIKLPQI